MTPPLNPWLPSILAKARKLFEDSDRVTRAAQLFTSTITRVHRLATSSAIVCPEPWPTVERFQPEEGSPVLLFEWHDQSSGWHLEFAVRRSSGIKPFMSLDFRDAGAGYTIADPTDADIIKGLYDYFENWKREGAVR